MVGVQYLFLWFRVSSIHWIAMFQSFTVSSRLDPSRSGRLRWESDDMTEIDSQIGLKIFPRSFNDTKLVPYTVLYWVVNLVFFQSYFGPRRREEYYVERYKKDGNFCLIKNLS